MNKRFNFLGVEISIINLHKAVKILSSYSFPVPAYICFPDAFVISEASNDIRLHTILNNAFLTMPDGKPSVLAAHLQGHKDVTTVSGFHLCNELLQTKLTHYFYGGSVELLAQLQKNIETKYPDAKVLGYKAPPFLKLDNIHNNTLIRQDIEEIKQVSPDLVWVGISSPKQDYLMDSFYRQLDKSVMLGVGGVFLYLADETLKSPEWVKKAGLRWFFRLAKEPKRLWPKYYNTLRFLIKNKSYFINAFLYGKSKPDI